MQIWSRKFEAPFLKLPVARELGKQAASSSCQNVRKQAFIFKQYMTVAYGLCRNSLFAVTTAKICPADILGNGGDLSLGKFDQKGFEDGIT